jgi:hypothetical protein
LLFFFYARRKICEYPLFIPIAIGIATKQKWKRTVQIVEVILTFSNRAKIKKTKLSGNNQAVLNPE